jgi:hypothetical protein
MMDGRYRYYPEIIPISDSTAHGLAGALPPVRHWLLLQLCLGATGWAVILLGISCFV